jgi:hypothetical protein
MKRSLASLVMVSAVVVARYAIVSCAVHASQPATDLAPRFARDVAVLASDEMEGRGLGTAGLGRAADWIEKRVRAIGLAPAFPGGYRQDFDVKTGVALEEGNALEGVAIDSWVPLGMSSPGASRASSRSWAMGSRPRLPAPRARRTRPPRQGRPRPAHEPQERDEGSPFDGAGRADGRRCATRCTRRASAARPQSCS